MPRENRKRGKKHKKKAEDDGGAPQPQEPEPQYEEEAETIETGPSWIVSARQNPVDLNAPFGFVDAEVKAYFRTVDVQIREWQETRPETEGDEDMDPNEGEHVPLCTQDLASRSFPRPPPVLCRGFDGDVWKGEATCN